MYSLDDLFDVKELKYNWGVIEKISEFEVLKTCEQNPKWHGEGNAFIHTKKCCEEAIKLAHFLDYDDRKILFGAVLFHDIGKGVTTEFKKNAWHSYGHEIKGESITRILLWDEDVEVRESICSLVRWHMEPLNVFKSSHYIDKIIDLSAKTNLSLLKLVKTCDVLGSMPEEKKQTDYDIYLLERFKSIAIALDCYINSSRANRILIKDINNFNKPDITVHVLIGLPGAGKTTIYENVIKKYDKDVTLISRDIARYVLGYCRENEKYLGTRDEEDNVTAYCNKLIIDCAEKGKNMVIDNTHLKRKYRDDLKNLLKNYNVFYCYHYVETSSLNENLKRSRR